MTEQQKQNAFDDAVIQLELTVAQINGMLNILGQAPYVASVNLIALIQSQAEPQFKRLVEAEKIVREAQAKNEG